MTRLLLLWKGRCCTSWAFLRTHVCMLSQRAGRHELRYLALLCLLSLMHIFLCAHWHWFLTHGMSMLYVPTRFICYGGAAMDARLPLNVMDCEAFAHALWSCFASVLLSFCMHCCTALL